MGGSNEQASVFSNRGRTRDRYSLCATFCGRIRSGDAGAVGRPTYSACRRNTDGAFDLIEVKSGTSVKSGIWNENKRFVGAEIERWSFCFAQSKRGSSRPTESAFVMKKRSVSCSCIGIASSSPFYPQSVEWRLSQMMRSNPNCQKFIISIFHFILLRIIYFLLFLSYFTTI